MVVSEYGQPHTRSVIFRYRPSIRTLRLRTIWYTVGRKRSTMRASPAGRQNTNSALPSSTATTFILPNFHGFWNTENGNKRKFQQKDTIPQGWCFFVSRLRPGAVCFSAPEFRFFFLFSGSAVSAAIKKTIGLFDR